MQASEEMFDLLREDLELEIITWETYLQLVRRHANEHFTLHVWKQLEAEYSHT
jgi:hypothetical protein